MGAGAEVSELPPGTGAADDGAGGEDDDGDDDGDDGDEDGDEDLPDVGGRVTQAEIEAEVAELLGEVPPPPVERDHTRLFHEATTEDEQAPPTT